MTWSALYKGVQVSSILCHFAFVDTQTYCVAEPGAQCGVSIDSEARVS